MSKAAEERTTAKTAIPVARKTKTADRQPGTVMYIGPTIKKVVVKNTIFNNGLPAALEEQKKKMPILGSLIVPVEQLVEARKNMNKSSSAIRTCYEQVLSILQEEGDE